jgi:hypothetical protein
MPELLRQRPVVAQVLLPTLPAAAFGALCGWLLGVSEIAYTIFTLLGIAGGYAAGLEHQGWREGAIRGLVGGSLFGAFILIVHEATGKSAKADLPEPEIVLVAITTVFGVALGAAGGRRRAAVIEAGEEDRPMFEFSNLHWSELVGFAGSAVLLGSLFLPWFSTSCDTIQPRPSPAGCNTNSVLSGGKGQLESYGNFTAFETFRLLDVLLVAACIAPFVLAYIIVRSHDLTWRPGEVTMIVGMVAVALVLLNGVILGKPGEDSVDISLAYGWFVGLLGAALIMAGGTLRQALTARDRKPPGVL